MAPVIPGIPELPEEIKDTVEKIQNPERRLTFYVLLFVAIGAIAGGSYFSIKSETARKEQVKDLKAQLASSEAREAAKDVVIKELTLDKYNLVVEQNKKMEEAIRYKDSINNTVNNAIKQLKK